MTLPEIAQTWLPVQRLSQEDKSMVLGRLEICDICPFKKQLLSGQFFSGPNDPNSVFYCGACGCGLFSKTKDPDNVCPENHWQQYEQKESFY